MMFNFHNASIAKVADMSYVVSELKTVAWDRVKQNDNNVEWKQCCFELVSWEHFNKSFYSSSFFILWTKRAEWCSTTAPLCGEKSALVLTRHVYATEYIVAVTGCFAIVKSPDGGMNNTHNLKACFKQAWEVMRDYVWPPFLVHSLCFNYFDWFLRMCVLLDDHAIVYLVATLVNLPAKVRPFDNIHFM